MPFKLIALHQELSIPIACFVSILFLNLRCTFIGIFLSHILSHLGKLLLYNKNVGSGLLGFLQLLLSLFCQLGELKPQFLLAPFLDRSKTILKVYLHKSRLILLFAVGHGFLTLYGKLYAECVLRLAFTLYLVHLLFKGKTYECKFLLVTVSHKGDLGFLQFVETFQFLLGLFLCLLLGLV